MKTTVEFSDRCRSVAGSAAVSVAKITLFAAISLLPFRVNAQSSGYSNYEELTAKLRMFADHHDDIARLVSSGKTLEGRDIWVMEIGTTSGVPQAERPALMVGANLEGNQLIGSEIALGLIHYLVDGYEEDEQIQLSLEKYVFYIFPRMNPDGAEKNFRAIQTGSETNSRPFDDDNDGRIDEDGPDDLDGNGIITVMRVLDPFGEYMIDPDDDRLMIKADAAKGETGAYSIYWEGLDDDNDGFYNEDPRGGVNLNRNFQHEYPYYKAGAGPHMVSENESRSIMDYVIEHRNIAMMLTFGAHDNLVNALNKKGELSQARPINLFDFADASLSGAREVGIFRAPQTRFFSRTPSQPETSDRPSGRRPATTVNESDQEYFKVVSEKYGEITGIETPPSTQKPAGAFFEYGYYQFGVPSFTTPGWGFSEKDVSEKTDSTGQDTIEKADSTGQDTTEKADSTGQDTTEKAAGKGKETENETVDQELVAYLDAQGIDGFVNWTAFDHPTLDNVEIGGFKPLEAVNPPAGSIEELIEKQGEFLLYLSSLFAEIKIARIDVTDHGGGIFRIKAEIENVGFLPTALAHGVTSRSVKPTMVQLGIDPENLVSGDAKTSFFQSLDGSGSRRKFEWIVKGKTGEKVELRVVSQKGGTDTAEVTLR